MGGWSVRATPDPAPETNRYLLHTVASGAGPPLVLIHGVAGSNLVWDRIVPLLEPHFTVVRLDLLGYGHSPKPRVSYTPYGHVVAIRRTLEQRGVGAPIVLVGLSMGADLMLEYAAHWPEEVQEMIGIGFPYYPSETAARIGLRHNPWTRLALEHPVLSGACVPLLWLAGRHVTGLFRHTGGLYTGAMAKDALRVRYRAFRSSLLNCMVHYQLQGPLAASGDMRRLFIHGSADEWATAEAVREAIDPFARSVLSVIDGAPHNLVAAEAPRTAALILDHLGVTSQAT